MTGIRLSRQAERDLEHELGKESEAEFQKVEEEEVSGLAGSILSELNEIGRLEEGSLEEAIWRELGALPQSRRCKRWL